MLLEERTEILPGRGAKVLKRCAAVVPFKSKKHENTWVYFLEEVPHTCREGVHIQRQVVVDG